MTRSTSSPRRTRGRSTSARRWSWRRAATSRRWRRTRCAARRVTVVPAGSVDPALPADLAPRRRDPPRGDRQRPHRRGAARRRSCSTCAGSGIAVDDLGTDGTDAGGLSGHRRRAVARAVARGEADAGIVIDGAGHRIGDRGQQGPRHPRRDVHRRDDRPLRPRAQRRERADARGRRCCRTRRGHPDRRHLARHADARGALHPAAAEDPAAGRAF